MVAEFCFCKLAVILSMKAKPHASVRRKHVTHELLFDRPEFA